jgi:hypothetical protein
MIGTESLCSFFIYTGKKSSTFTSFRGSFDKLSMAIDFCLKTQLESRVLSLSLYCFEEKMKILKRRSDQRGINIQRFGSAGMYSSLMNNKIVKALDKAAFSKFETPSST